MVCVSEIRNVLGKNAKTSPDFSQTVQFSQIPSQSALSLKSHHSLFFPATTLGSSLHIPWSLPDHCSCAHTPKGRPGVNPCLGMGHWALRMAPPGRAGASPEFQLPGSWRGRQQSHVGCATGSIFPMSYCQVKGL